MGWVWSADWSANPGPSVTTPERCCLSQLIHFWVYIDKPEPWISQFSLTKVPALFFFCLFSIPKLLAALAGWQSSVWLFLYNFLNSDLFFLHEGDALFPVLCQLSLILWTVFQCLIYCRVRTVPAFIHPLMGAGSVCVSWNCTSDTTWNICALTYWWKLKRISKNWEVLSFCGCTTKPCYVLFCPCSNSRSCLEMVSFWTWNPYFFLGNGNFQVWQIVMETKKSPLFKWQSKKTPPKALCDSVLSGGKSSGSFLGARICWKCSQGKRWDLVC